MLADVLQGFKRPSKEKISYEKKEMMPLTSEEKETHENQKNCY